MKDEDAIRKITPCAPDTGASAEAIEANERIQTEVVRLPEVPHEQCGEALGRVLGGIPPERMNELVEEDHALQVCCKDGWSGTQLEFDFPEDADGVC